MIVSFDKKFLFCHLLRTGGTSIKRALKPYSSQPERFMENRILRALGIRINHWTAYERKWFRGHTSAGIAKCNMPSDVWSDLFRFTIVRNPFDRMVSLYHHLPRHKSGRGVRDLTFHEFVNTWSRRPEFQQKPLITDENGKLLVDFVGHFESLREDFRYICQKIGLEADLEHANASPRQRDYRDYYTPELISVVQEVFSDDLESFGYQFSVPESDGRLNAA
ncbi:MAG: sulfotransferase family protein [Fuerstiella sp.]|nr:sulfotransferase family protein [Fuerstiella sp.]